MSDEKKVYVIGHRNPDTDSIVSAIAYAELKKEQGQTNCFPARAGKLNPQTEYILEKFNIEQPKFISDLIPRVRNYMSHHPVTVNKRAPLWKALEILNAGQHKMLPIVDDNGRFSSVLHYNAFAQNMLKKINPHEKAVIPTSLNLLQETLNGKLVSHRDRDEIFDARIVVAASDIASVKAYSEIIPPENCIVMVGNRSDVQDYVIENSHRCLIVTGNHTVSESQQKKAQSRGVSILLSPYDTVTTSALTLYSTPVIYMTDEEIQPLRQDHYIKTIKKQLSESLSRALPVVDDEGLVIGILSQGDLMRDPNIDLIMVDHNELSQSLEGIENFRILEIIDHHRLGNLHTSYPITFINKPVGSTSTIVATLYSQMKMTIRPDIAGILLAGILSDTLVLRSATTTDEDRDIARSLSDISGLEIQKFGSEIMNASSLVSKKPAGEIIGMDLKKYNHGDASFTVSQVEVNSLQELRKRKEEIQEELEALCEKENLLFSALMATDITLLNSALFISGEPSVIKEVAYPRLDEKIYLLKGIVSRKKQLLPYITDLLKRIV